VCVCVFVAAGIRAAMCACVCVCVCERERERERESNLLNTKTNLTLLIQKLKTNTFLMAYFSPHHTYFSRRYHI